MQSLPAHPVPGESAAAVTGGWGIDRVTCHLCQVGKGFRLLPHVHRDQHEIYLITRGRACANIGEARYVGEIGDVLYHPRGQTHFPEEVGGSALEFLHLRWHGGDGLMRDWVCNPVHDQHGHIRHLLEWIMDLESLSTPTHDALRGCLVETLLREGVCLQHDQHSRLVHRISRFVRTNMGSNLMLEDLAHAVNMSKFHFSRRFREESGKSPMQFTSEMRIQAAKRMLQQTDMTISAIAAAVGLRDAAHFSHVFKRHTGYSPGAFRSAR